jgi:hypothetical protein
MSNAFDRAECCHKLAEECRRLSRMCCSIEMQIHYARMSEHYSTLADAELLGGLAYEHSLPEDGTSPAALNERHDPTQQRRLAGRAGAPGGGAATRRSMRSTEDRTAVPPKPTGHLQRHRTNAA